jgi:hypothetical protein
VVVNLGAAYLGAIAFQMSLRLDTPGAALQEIETPGSSWQLRSGHCIETLISGTVASFLDLEYVTREPSTAPNQWTCREVMKPRDRKSESVV